MIELKNANQVVTIDAGELTGYRVNDHEFIHQKGSPGWRSSDTEMFPIIGPTAEAGFRVQTPRGEARQDQHGLLPAFGYDAIKGYVKGEKMDFPYDNQQAVQMDAFARNILDKTPVVANGEDGLQDMRIIEAVYKSAQKNGKMVKI